MTNLANKISNFQEENVSLNWQDNPASQDLLDVLVQILKEDYLETARQNPEIFSQ